MMVLHCHLVAKCRSGCEQQNYTVQLFTFLKVNFFDENGKNSFSFHSCRRIHIFLALYFYLDGACSQTVTPVKFFFIFITNINCLWISIFSRTPAPCPDPHLRTWLDSGTFCSLPSMTSLPSLMSCSRSRATSGSCRRAPRRRYNYPPNT